MTYVYGYHVWQNGMSGPIETIDENLVKVAAMAAEATTESLSARAYVVRWTVGKVKSRVLMYEFKDGELYRDQTKRRVLPAPTDNLPNVYRGDEAVAALKRRRQRIDDATFKQIALAESTLQRPLPRTRRSV